jgi:hypothetical protein
MSFMGHTWGLLLRKNSFIRNFVFFCTLPLLMGLRFVDDMNVIQEQGRPLQHGLGEKLEQETARQGSRPKRQSMAKGRTSAASLRSIARLRARSLSLSLSLSLCYALSLFPRSSYSNNQSLITDQTR